MKWYIHTSKMMKFHLTADYIIQLSSCYHLNTTQMWKCRFFESFKMYEMLRTSNRSQAKLSLVKQIKSNNRVRWSIERSDLVNVEHPNWSFEFEQFFSPFTWSMTVTKMIIYDEYIYIRFISSFSEYITILSFKWANNQQLKQKLYLYIVFKLVYRLLKMFDDV